MAQQLDAAHTEALRMFLQEPLNREALARVCALQESRCRDQAVSALNLDVQDLHEEAKQRAQSKKYAGMAFAWARVVAEIEKAAKG